MVPLCTPAYFYSFWGPAKALHQQALKVREFFIRYFCPQRFPSCKYVLIVDILTNVPAWICSCSSGLIENDHSSTVRFIQLWIKKKKSIFIKSLFPRYFMQFIVDNKVLWFLQWCNIRRTTRREPDLHLKWGR